MSVQMPSELSCKNRLQEYVQRTSLPLPVYRTVYEGAQHAPHFRSQVWVNGTCFVSPNAFPNKKMAEQDAAKHALIGILEKVKNEGHSRILEDTVFCKSIIHEYAVKMNLKPPTYMTNESKALIPMFVSSVELNGVTYVGHAGKNKKEAEQSAARSAILTILGSESCSKMSEIVTSKFKFYDEMKKVDDSSTGTGGVNQSQVFMDLSDVPGEMNPLQDNIALSLANKRKEVPLSAEIPPSNILAIQNGGQISNTQVTHGPVHVFKKPRLQNSLVEFVPQAIEFVPPASEQAPISVKRKQRKNKKGKKKACNQSLLAVGMSPQTQVTAYSAAQ